MIKETKLFLHLKHERHNLIKTKNLRKNGQARYLNNKNIYRANQKPL